MLKTAKDGMYETQKAYFVDLSTREIYLSIQKPISSSTQTQKKYGRFEG